jgi:DNA-binding NarL/FixJ family response regulator
VLLDIGLPGMSGLEVVKRLRERSPSLPVLMLSGQAGEVDAVVGLDAGADDYVARPYRVAELMARVRALLRRTTTDGASVNGIRVDASSRRAWQRTDRGEVAYVHRDEDPRDYKVSFAKIHHKLGYQVSMSVPRGIEELIAALDEGRFKDPFDARHRNVP